MSLVFVTGAPRSGTSMVCQALHVLGLDFGAPLGGPNPANRHGFMEHLNFRQFVTKRWLRERGADPSGQWPLPARQWEPTPDQVAACRQGVRKVLAGAGAVKDPKILLIWPILHAAFPDARWILVRRDPDQIARSCHRTRFMHCRDTVEGWREWVGLIEERIADCLAGTDAVEVWPDPRDPDSLRVAVEHAGLAWDPVLVESVLHPEAWRGE